MRNHRDRGSSRQLSVDLDFGENPQSDDSIRVHVCRVDARRHELVLYPDEEPVSDIPREVGLCHKMQPVSVPTNGKEA